MMTKKNLPQPNLPHVMVLLSGGIDSVAVLAAYLSSNHPVEALFVDYGQPALRSEHNAAQALSAHFGVPLTTVKLGFQLPNNYGEFFGRNALFLLLAGAATVVRPLILAIGIHSSSPYYDTTKTFAGDIQRVFDGYAGGMISLGTPFLEMTKDMVVKFARRHKVPFDLTYSCETKSAPVCGICPSCRDRRDYHVD